MSTERRPAPRPTTRVPGNVSAPAKAPTGRVPQAQPPRPATGRIPTAPAPEPARKTTSRVTHAAPGTSRSVRGGDHQASTRSVPAAKKGNPMLLWGGVGGGALLLIIIIAIAASGGSKKHPEASNAKKAVKPVDVAGLEHDGEAKCQEGLAIIQRCEGLMTGRELSAGEKTKLKGDLDRGIHLIQEGMGRFEEANAKSGNKYDTTQYGKAYKAAKMKLGELGGK